MSTTRQPWQCSDSGILRKKEDDEEELLVFGYSCKLFRDDEKALFIDQGKHLIPWMGDETLKIDRYDGRGALYDLKQCEPLPGGHDENWWVGLSEAERHVEQLCDEERYRALNHNEEEEALYQEEELKRLHQALGNNAYGQVAFDYDEPNGKPEEKGDGEVLESGEPEEDEVFVAPSELDIPIGMTVPETVKLNAIIEKTALFISKQGPQMEILLKMKQANNPQFQFLSYDAPLHPYYRHLLSAIKTGRYHPQAPSQAKEETPEEMGDDHYLHPSLAATGSRVELAPSIPSISYRPSNDCAYSMLVSRIKDKQVAMGLVPASKIEEPTRPSTVVPCAAVPSALPSVTPTSAPVVAHPYYVAEPVISAAPVRYNLNPEKEAEPVPKPAAAVAVPVAPVAPVAPVVSAPVASAASTVALAIRAPQHAVAAPVKEIRKASVSAVAIRSDTSSRSNSPHVLPSITTPQPDMQERLSPKYNGEVRCTTSLYARIQASNSSLRKLRESGCGSEASNRTVEVRGSHKRRHLCDHEGSRSHLKGEEESSHRHKKAKKKEHRARSHSRPHGSQSSHSHYQPYRSVVEWDQHRHKKKKKKKKSHHRSSSESS